MKKVRLKYGGMVRIDKCIDNKHGFLAVTPKRGECAGVMSVAEMKNIAHELLRCAHACEDDSEYHGESGLML